MKLVGVHGFNFGHWLKRPDGFYDALSALCGRDVDGFQWHSSPLIWPTNWIRARLKGQEHPYRLAYHVEAYDAADALAAKLADLVEPYDLICHSLGSLVALRALWRVRLAGGPAARRMVILNGAAMNRDVRLYINSSLSAPLAKRVLNVKVASDDVLAGLARRASGKDGPVLGIQGLAYTPDWWTELTIDNDEVRERARKVRGWEIGGNGPGISDHAHTYTHAGNGPLIRSFFHGDNLAELVDR